MSMTMYKVMKLQDGENKVLERELQRMQQIDRIKVSHAMDAFYNPETKSMLPSLDTCQASMSEDLGMGT